MHDWFNDFSLLRNNAIMETGDHGKCVLKPVGKFNVKESKNRLTRQFVKRVATCQMRNDMELQLVATKGCSESFYIMDPTEQ